MKRFVAILLILVLVFALSATAFAASNVTSPEKGNTNPDVNPDSGKASPQTGESFSILWVILAAVAAVGAVLFCGKKLVRAK